MHEIRADDAPSFDDHPFSQAIVHGDTVYLSGNAPVTPDGDIVEGGIREQTEQVMENIGAILTAANTSYEQIVKARAFLADKDSFEGFNEVYREYVSEPYPARCTVVTDHVVDVGLEVEIVAAIE